MLAVRSTEGADKPTEVKLAERPGTDANPPPLQPGRPDDDAPDAEVAGSGGAEWSGVPADAPLNERDDSREGNGGWPMP